MTGRRLALPLAALAPPPLFLLYREVALCGTPAGCSGVEVAGYALLALLSPGGAWLVDRAVAAGRAPAWLAPRPDDRTLVLLVAIAASLVGYLAAATARVVPPWLDALLAPVAVLLSLPLVIVHAMLIGLARPIAEPSPAVELAVVAVGVGLSGVWWYLLAKTVAGWSTSLNEPPD